jgi:hypothetical protein
MPETVIPAQLPFSLPSACHAEALSVTGRCRPMLGFKRVPSATRYCRGLGELRNFLAPDLACANTSRTAIALGILEAA